MSVRHAWMMVCRRSFVETYVRFLPQDRYIRTVHACQPELQTPANNKHKQETTKIIIIIIVASCQTVLCQLLNTDNKTYAII